MKLKEVFKVLGFIIWVVICMVVVMVIPEVLGKKWLEIIIELGVLFLMGAGFLYLYMYKLINYLFPEEEGKITNGLGVEITRIIAEHEVMNVPVSSRLFSVLGSKTTWYWFRTYYRDYDFWLTEGWRKKE